MSCILVQIYVLCGLQVTVHVVAVVDTVLTLTAMPMGTSNSSRIMVMVSISNESPLVILISAHLCVFKAMVQLGAMVDKMHMVNLARLRMLLGETVATMVLSRQGLPASNR